jgi:class 3 adenylate cyclase
MFCDLIGSTAISAKLDAEEWRDLVGSYLDAASAAVMEMGGHAHENDPERAARAALSIQRALAELNRKNAGSGMATSQRGCRHLAEPSAVVVTGRCAEAFFGRRAGHAYPQGRGRHL